MISSKMSSRISTTEDPDSASQMAKLSPDLRAAFEKHKREKKGQVERLEKVFGLRDQALKGKKCEAIEGSRRKAR
jgi:ferritin-like metal-binding protein YciE